MQRLSEAVALPTTVRNLLPKALKKRTTTSERSQRRARVKTLKKHNPAGFKQQKKENRKAEFEYRKANMGNVARDTAISTLAATGTIKASEKVGKIMSKHDEKRKTSKAKSFSKEYLGEAHLNEFISTLLKKGGQGVFKKAATKFGKDVAKETVVAGALQGGTAIAKRGMDKKSARDSEEKKRVNAGKEIAQDKEQNTPVDKKKNSSISSQMGESIHHRIRSHGKTAALTVALSSGPELINHAVQRKLNAPAEKDREEGSKQDVKHALQKRREQKGDKKASARWSVLRTMDMKTNKPNPQHKRGVELGGEKTKASSKSEEIISLRAREVVEVLGDMGSTLTAVTPRNVVAGMNAQSPQGRNAAAGAKTKTDAADASRKIRSTR